MKPPFARRADSSQCRTPAIELLVSSHRPYCRSARSSGGVRVCTWGSRVLVNAFTENLEMTRVVGLAIRAALAIALGCTAATSAAQDFNDSHFHLTNYIQEGLTLP